MKSMKKRNRIVLLVILLLCISIGYAFVYGDLSIEGIASINKQTWDVHFENVQVKSGSVAPVHEAIINSEYPTQVSYEIKLDNPGDFYEFEVDVVNAGTIDAMVSDISLTNNNQPISLPSYMAYSITYKDGREIKKNHLLAKATKEGNETIPTVETYKVRIEFRSDITAADLVGIQQLNLSLKFEVTYGQAKNAYEREKTMFLTGSEVNVKMKELAGDTGATTSTADTNIVAIKHSTTEPTSENKQADNKVSIEGSTKDIYMWYENGTIYWWSEDIHPSLNTDSSNMFRDLHELINIEGLEDLDVSFVESLQSSFNGAVKLTNISPIKNWDISNAKSLRSTFACCIALTDISPLENWNTSNVTTMYGTFMGLTSIGYMHISSLKPLRKWDISHVEDMQAMFQHNHGYTSLEGLENWKPLSVEKMRSTFLYNLNLSDISALENWNVSSVKNMYAMFSDDTSLTDATALAKWETDNLETTAGMFVNCTNLQTVDISKFKVSHISDSHEMFNNCPSLTTIYGYESFNTNTNTNSTDMFNGCTSLVGGNNTTYDATHIDKEYARVGTTDQAGYFKLKPTQ